MMSLRRQLQPRRRRPLVSDPEGGISGYHLVVGVSPAGSNVFDGILSATSASATNFFGQTLYARVSAINNAGIEGPLSLSSPGTILLDPNGDYDGDGMSNWAEDFAGTDPLSSNSVFRVLGLANGNLLTWSSVSNKQYRVFATLDLGSNLIPISGVITASSSSTSYLDTAPPNARKFYRVNVLP
jgi:hypothetical protein